LIISGYEFEFYLSCLFNKNYNINVKIYLKNMISLMYNRIEYSLSREKKTTFSIGYDKKRQGLMWLMQTTCIKEFKAGLPMPRACFFLNDFQAK